MKNHLMQMLADCSGNWSGSHLGQHSFIFKIADKIIAFDPFLTPVDGRLQPPFIPAEEFENVDIIFGSHDHGDHIDRPSLAAMAAASPRAVFVFPQAVIDSITEIPHDRICGLNDGMTIEINGIKITGIAAAHELLEPTPEGLYPCLGFVVEYAGKTLYHSGDCCIYEGLQTKLSSWHFDLMMLPINGRDADRYRTGCIGNMTFQEAVDLAGVLKPELVWPAHYDMFPGNLADPLDFLKYLQVKYPGVKSQFPPTGKVRILP